MKTRYLCLSALVGVVAGAMAATDSAPKVYQAPAPSPATPAASSKPEAAPNPAPPPSGAPKKSAADIEKLAAPIALYPDPLIASLLPASVYPLEIVQAARFVANTNNLRMLDAQPWDSNVKAVARIPALIAKMNEDLNWTIQLGQAFLDQPMELMDAIQALRAKAQKAGALKTTAQQVVTVTNATVERIYQDQVVYVTNTVIQVQPASSEIIYVPQYNPTVVYAASPVYVDPVAPLISFGVGMAVGAAVWGHCDWYYGGCYWGGHPPPPPPYPPPYHPPPGAPPPPPAGRPPGSPPPASRPPSGQPPANRPPGTQPPGNRPPVGDMGGSRPPTASTLPAQRWQPDQSRLSSAGAPSVSTREARGWGGSGSGASGATGTRPGTGTTPSFNRPSTTPAPSGNRPSTSPSISQPRASSPSVNRSAPSSAGRDSAFSGAGSGSSSTRNYSNRGSTSRSGGGFSGGGRGGGFGGGGRGGRR